MLTRRLDYVVLVLKLEPELVNERMDNSVLMDRKDRIIMFALEILRRRNRGALAVITFENR